MIPASLMYNAIWALEAPGLGSKLEVYDVLNLRLGANGLSSLVQGPVVVVLDAQLPGGD
jgi:hypothetical protein